MEEPDDELVPFARIVQELGWSRYKVRLAMGQAGARLKQVQPPPSWNRRGRRGSLYPLAYTLRLLREGGRGNSKFSAVDSEERVPFDRIVGELGWSPTTVTKYLRSAGRSVIVFSDPEDNRKRLYPLPHTLKVLRREEARVHARRDRSRDEAAGYWLALAQLKVAASHLREASGDLAAASRKVTAAHDALRKKPPTAGLEIRTLPDTGLTLSHPLCVFVSPLRLTYWKAVAPEIIEFPAKGHPRKGSGGPAAQARFRLSSARTGARSGHPAMGLARRDHPIQASSVRAAERALAPLAGDLFRVPRHPPRQTDT